MILELSPSAAQLMFLLEFFGFLTLGPIVVFLIVYWLIRRSLARENLSILEIRRMYARGELSTEDYERELARRGVPPPSSQAPDAENGAPTDKGKAGRDD